MKRISFIICLLLPVCLHADINSEMRALADEIILAQKKLVALAKESAMKTDDIEAFRRITHYAKEFENSPSDNLLAVASNMIMQNPDLLLKTSRKDLDSIMHLIQPRIDGSLLLSRVLVDSYIIKETKDGMLVSPTYYWNSRNGDIESTKLWMEMAVSKTQDRIMAAAFLEREASKKSK